MSILDLVASQLGQSEVSQISNNIGADESTTSKAIGMALPVLVSAMSRNTQQESGANALAGALERDHDGSILDNLGGFLGQNETGMGNAILGHVLGNKLQTVQGGLSQASGLQPQQSGQLLATLAPILMGTLGRQKQQQGLGAGDIAGMLLGDRQRVEEANPQMGMLGRMLDADGDGSVIDDVAEIGLNMLGNYLKGRK